MKLPEPEADEMMWRREWNGDVSDLGMFIHADYENELDRDGPWEKFYSEIYVDRLRSLCEQLKEDAERYKWLRQHLHVAAESPKSWTCWLHLDQIPYRSQEEDAEKLLDILIGRFPLDVARKESDDKG